MLKCVIYGLVVIAVASLVASGIHLYRVAQKNKKEMAPYQGAQVAVNGNFGKVLVVYYSLTGRTKDIAERIRAKTDADIYEIKTAEKFDTNLWFYMKARAQLKEGKYPTLSGKMPEFSEYDWVFVGFPVWWYTAATPGLAFLEQTDFKGKKVVPFSTQGSNAGTFFKDFEMKAKNADLQAPASFNNLPEKYDAAVDNKIAVWLNNLLSQK